MSVHIRGIVSGSLADRKGIAPGDRLCRVNRREIEDVLDYRFAMTAERVQLVLERSGERRIVTLRKQEQEDIGLLFDSYLMDDQKSCRNRCIFCFIDQLPPGLRESLYFKDDDARLSFLFGNYITLTNLRERDIARIIDMRISPVRVSVHTTNPALRCEMLGNRFAGSVMETLRRFAAAGLPLHCQLVLCPGINDGAELVRTLADLESLRPAVASIAAVPVGLTRFREGLAPLRLFTADEAAAVIDEMERRDSGICYPADEFYLLAGRPIPPAERYGELEQLENGVGMAALFRDEFRRALDEIAAAEPHRNRPKATGRRVVIATGTAFAPLLEPLLEEVRTRLGIPLPVRVVPVVNRFFGETVTVAGLLTGGDLTEQLRAALAVELADSSADESADKSADEIWISRAMLRREGDRFLDDMTPEQVSAALGVPVRVIEADGGAVVRELLMNNR